MAAYAAAAERMPSFTLREDGRLIALLCLEAPGPGRLGIHLMAVDPALHGRGTGRALVEAATAEARRQGAEVLEVETVGPLHPSPAYAATRAFYGALGFEILGEDADAWGPGVSRLRLARAVRNA